MSTLLLRLEGPLQAWSSQGKLSVRDTEREPTKSGVLGLVGAAIGMDRSDDATLAELVRLAMAVRVDRAGSLLRDFHTAGGGRFRGREYWVHDAKDCVPSERYYLQDASFVVGLSGERSLLERIVRGFAAPKWPLFLGRRSCPLAVAPLVGLRDAGLADAVRAAPQAERVDDARLRMVIECADGEAGDTREDVPLSFAEGARRYASRRVRTEWVEFAKPEAATQEARP